MTESSDGETLSRKIPKMTLKEKFTTVTPFSKTLAMTLFVILPLVAFLLGVEYGKLVSFVSNSNVSQTEKAPAAMNQKTLTYSNKEIGLAFDYPENWGRVSGFWGNRTGYYYAKYESKLTYIISFTQSKTRIKITPNGWRWTGGDRDVLGFPITVEGFNQIKESLSDNGADAWAYVKLLNKTDRIAYLESEGISGSIILSGIVNINLPNIGASIVEINGPGVADSCGEEIMVTNNISATKPVRSCFTDDYINEFVSLVKSIRGI